MRASARVVFGAWDPKAGACGSLFDLTREPRATHRLDVFGGVCAEEMPGAACGASSRRGARAAALVQRRAVAADELPVPTHSSKST